jgi:Tfp pilus assembly protein PilO
VNLENKILARAGWLIAALLVVVGGNVLFYILGVANLDKLTRSLKVRAAENKKQLAAAEIQAATLSGNVGRITAGQDFMDQLASETLKTRPERLVLMQEEVAKLMKDAGLSSDQMGYTYHILPPKSEKSRWRHRYLKTTLQLGVSGSYPQLKNFILSLQNSPQFFTVDNLTVSTTAQGTVVLHASLLVSTYFIATETDRAGA